MPAGRKRGAVRLTPHLYSCPGPIPCRCTRPTGRWHRSTARLLLTHRTLTHSGPSRSSLPAKDSQSTSSHEQTGCFHPSSLPFGLVSTLVLPPLPV